MEITGVVYFLRQPPRFYTTGPRKKWNLYDSHKIQVFTRLSAVCMDFIRQGTSHKILYDRYVVYF